MRARAWLAVPVLLLAAVPAAACGSESAAGGIRFFKVARSSFDRYTATPGPAEQAWMRKRYWRMLTYSPYFDSRLTWYPDAWVYKDLYAIHAESMVAASHPEWILRDSAGQPLFIPYQCAGGRCPQYAADVGSAAFRAYWIAEAGSALARGYRGLFVDDVNMALSRVSDGEGRAVVPRDPRTGGAMSEAGWRGAMADFTEEIRAAFPRVELVHNALWFVGHDDPAVQRQLLSADYLNLERGANDDGLRAGWGPYGFETLLAHVDWLHAHGRAVVFDGGAPSDRAREYGLAAFLVVGGARDTIGNTPGGEPDAWWPGYDLRLGAPRGKRYAWRGVIRRDFEQGMALVNGPEAPRRVLALDPGYADAAGQVRATRTLGPAEGAVLRRRMAGEGEAVAR